MGNSIFISSNAVTSGGGSTTNMPKAGTDSFVAGVNKTLSWTAFIDDTFVFNIDQCGHEEISRTASGIVVKPNDTGTFDWTSIFKTP